MQRKKIKYKNNLLNISTHEQHEFSNPQIHYKEKRLLKKSKKHNTIETDNKRIQPSPNH